MSRAYRISVSESLRTVIRGSDHVSTQLQVLEILPRQEMAALQTLELLELGFEEDEECLRRNSGSVCIRVNPLTGEVTVSATMGAEIELEETLHGWGDEDFGEAGRVQAEERLRNEAQGNLKRTAEREQEKLVQQATDELEAALRDIQAELDKAVNRATAAALRLKAAQIGEIRRITEDSETGSMTIIVDV